ncbi:MAG TPA: flagellar M-ring protein FliF, partial [Allosphingosinicella sp.]
WEADWVAMLARNLTALGLAALLVFGVGRPLLRKRAAAVKDAPAAKANVGNEIAKALADRGQASESDITLSMSESAPSYEARAVLIRNFVRQDPARAALVVRDLLRADKAEGVEKNG